MQLNYLELPISLQYHFNKKISVSTGVKIAYLVVPNISVSADSTVSFLQENRLKSATYFDKADVSHSAAELGLNRWDFAATGGVHYNITNKIQLSLRADFGFKNVLNRANWLAYNRFFGLNAVYYFR